MVTGLHKQVLFREGNRKKPGLPAFMIPFAAGILMLSVLFFLNSSGYEPGHIFLMDRGYHLRFLVSVLTAHIITATAEPLRKYSHITGFLLLLASGYGLAEVVYGYYPLRSWPGLMDITGRPAAIHLQHAFFHRLYHIIPLFPVIAYYYLCFPANYFKNYLKIGNLSATTLVLNEKKPCTWKSILIKYSLLVLVLEILLLTLFKAPGAGRRPFMPIMLIPVLLYALWTCFVEESLFRGILLSVLSLNLEGKTANIIQALLFAIVHLDPGDLMTSIFKIVIFTILGWFFGRAVQDTKGIGTSYLMHVLLVLSIEIRLF